METVILASGFSSGEEAWELLLGGDSRYLGGVGSSTYTVKHPVTVTGACIAVRTTMYDSYHRPSYHVHRIIGTMPDGWTRERLDGLTSN